jgi:deoxyribodipyrimidine photo-lyase
LLIAPERVRQLNDAVPRAGSAYVLYWAQANRRVDSNHALAFAAGLANELWLPLLFYEGLTCTYPFASNRLHQFVLEGVPDNARRARELGMGYVFHLHARKSDPHDAVYRLTADAGVLVTDDYPSFVPARHNRTVPPKLEIPYYAVDSSCIVPMRVFGKQEYAAYTLRPKIRKILDAWLQPVSLPRLKRHWEDSSAAAKLVHTGIQPDTLPKSEIDHSILPSRRYRGGRNEAKRRLRHFLQQNLRRYASLAREPSADVTSRLSPYLHFGHISSLEIAVAVRKYATDHKMIADEFLEELIIRRELAFNFACYGPCPDSLNAVPAWAQTTLRKHSGDPRDFVYSREQFESAATHDALWNATQKELLFDGVIHGYYRMYWGKKIIERSPSHQEALDTMIYLHDRYALDGRDPNTYANILWCFGLHDRPWGERPVFGMVRYMSLEGMKRKTDVEAYIGRFQ